MTFDGGLADLARLSSAQSRQISPENPTGAVGGGAHATPDPGWPAYTLGRGWKVRPFIDMKPGQTETIADIDGPGCITHIWLTTPEPAYRDMVLRIYWDDEETASVETPLADFFACTHGTRHTVNSLPVSVNPVGGFNCYWPMPFRRRCRITLENQRWELIGGVFYSIDYELREVPDDAAYLHAQWRRSTTDPAHPEHVLLDGVTGRGHYVGTVISWTQHSDGWWGEGEVKFFLDDDGPDHPTICGTGTEDYFGGAWGFEDTFSTAFLGYPYWRRDAGSPPRHGLYRWHVPDPVRFTSALRVTIQALGWWPDGQYQPLADDIASLAYWYQTEPHALFPELPPAVQRRPT